MEGDFQVGAWLVQPKLNSIAGNGKTVRLEPKVMHVLVYLAEHAGEVIDKERLIQAVWADTFVTDDVLTRAISELRKTLHDDPHEARIIQTIPKGGYRLIAPVETGAADKRVHAMEGAPLSATIVGARHGVPLPTRRIVALAAGVLVALLAVLFGLNVAGLRDRVLLHPKPPAGKIMLVVLPFENLSGDPEQEYFSDGMTEEMTAQLGQLTPQQLGVIGRASAMTYKGRKKTIDEIGKELRVQYVLEGSVRRAGSRVRITAQLIEVGDQTHAWAEEYDRDVKDILALQIDVAQAIAREIRTKLTPQEQTRLVSARPLNPEAYEALLKGRFHMAKLTKEDMRKAEDLFQQAITIDPNYAPAYAALGSLNNLFGHADFLPPQEAFPRAKRAAEKALAIDPMLAEAHFARANARFLYDWDWSGAEKDFQRGFELSPNDVWAHTQYTGLLSAMGRSQEAIRDTRRALEIDPVSLLTNADLGADLFYARQYDEAIEQERKTLELDPTFSFAHLVLGWAYIEKGDLPRAIAEIQDSLRYGQYDSWRIFLGYAYAVAGDKPRARRVLADYQRISKPTYTSPLGAATMYAGLGEKEKALAALEKLYENRDHDMVFLRCFPWFDPLRSDPRFQDLLRRMNFPP